jgi:hypothetical protein
MSMHHTTFACDLRPLTHEQLAILAARLALALQDIVHNRVDSAIEKAESALRNTGVEAVQELVL